MLSNGFVINQHIPNLTAVIKEGDATLLEYWKYWTNYYGRQLYES